MQTKLGSILETVVGTIIGFIISILLNLIIFPAVGCQITPTQNISIITIFTFASIIRGYFVRRFFNKIALCYKI